MDETIETELLETLQNPRRVEVDGRVTEMPRGRDQVIVAEYLDRRNSTAASKSSRGMRITKLVPPGV